MVVNLLFIIKRWLVIKPECSVGNSFDFYEQIWAAQMFTIIKKTFSVKFVFNSPLLQNSHLAIISIWLFQKISPKKQKKKWFWGSFEVSDLHPSLPNKKDQQSHTSEYPGCRNFLFRSLESIECWDIWAWTKGSEMLGGLHPQGNPLASPKRNFNLILSSSSNIKVKFKSILVTVLFAGPLSPTHSHTATFKCALPLVAAHRRSPSTRKLSTMTTTASHSAGLCRAISRPNGRGVRCTCDLSALMMVIKNSCVPASHHSFMEEFEKYPTSFTKRSSD